MVYVKNEVKNRKLLKRERRELYINFLRNPTLPVVGTPLITKVKPARIKYHALKDYQLDMGQLYRKADEVYQARYIPQLHEDFRIHTASFSIPVFKLLTTSWLVFTTVSRNRMCAGLWRTVVSAR